MRWHHHETLKGRRHRTNNLKRLKDTTMSNNKTINNNNNNNKEIDHSIKNKCFLKPSASTRTFICSISNNAQSNCDNDGYGSLAFIPQPSTSLFTSTNNNNNNKTDELLLDNASFSETMTKAQRTTQELKNNNGNCHNRNSREFLVAESNNFPLASASLLSISTTPCNTSCLMKEKIVSLRIHKCSTTYGNFPFYFFASRLPFTLTSSPTVTDNSIQSISSHQTDKTDIAYKNKLLHTILYPLNVERFSSLDVRDPINNISLTSFSLNSSFRNNYNKFMSTKVSEYKSRYRKKGNSFINLLIIALIVLVHLLCNVSANWGDGLNPDSNTTFISQVLNRLTDRSKYDKRLRPRYGEGHVDVGITIHVSSISAVSEVDMDFTLDFYLRQTWHDPRLAFGNLDLHGFERIKSLTVGVDYLDKLWKPDTFFPNEKKSFFHTATTHNSFLRIEPDGRVYTSQRLTVTATCPMHLRLFPMDSQTCKLEIESYGYTINDISYYWGEHKGENKRAEDAVAFGDFSLPQFRPIGFRVDFSNATTSSGVYDRLNIQVILGRNLGFYLMNIVIPSMLIVSISWVSFWLSREASPARVGLGVTTVLTMTTLITTTNNSMPKVSYIKGLDVYLNFCFVMVFASLVEYAVVSYWNKRQCRMRERRRKRGAMNSNLTETTPTEIPMYTNYPTTPAGGLAISPPPSIATNINSSPNNYVYRAPGLLMTTTASGTPSPGSGVVNANSKMNIVNAPSQYIPNIPPDCDCRTMPLMQYNDAANMVIVGGGNPYSINPPQLGPYVNATMTRTRRRGGWRISGGGEFGTGSYGPGNWCCRRFSPSKIDRCSRSMFPLLFIAFNCFYWSVMTFLSQWTTNRQDFVPFKQHD